MTSIASDSSMAAACSALTDHALEEEEGLDELREDEQEDIVAKLAVMLLSISWTPAAALRTVVELDIPRILATHSPPRGMTAEELLQHAPRASKPNALNLERMMRLLTCKSIFSEEAEREGAGEGRLVRRYALTPLSRVLVPGHATGTMANFVRFTSMSPVFCKAMEHLSDSILSGGSAFESAFGMNAFQYMNAHQDQLHCFQAAMTDHTNQLLPLFLAKYQDFGGVRRLMDVGGGDGTTLARILARHPHIQHGINFDLAEVVARAQCHPGVEHVAGDMFKCVPSGCDAIFMKTIIHDWSDEDCLTILRNCHAALPPGGKLIIVDALVPAETSSNAEDYENVGTFMSDFCMQAHCPDGRERQAEEVEHLVKAAGFSRFRVVVRLDYMFVMEGVK